MSLNGFGVKDPPAAASCSGWTLAEELNVTAVTIGFDQALSAITLQLSDGSQATFG